MNSLEMSDGAEIRNGFTPNVANDDPLLTESQARTFLPLSLAWYRKMRWMHQGPPFLRIGNRVFYKRSALRAYVDEREKATEHGGSKPPADNEKRVELSHDWGRDK